MDKLRSKAYAEARILVRNKILEMKELSLETLTESQADQIENLISKKDSVVQEVAEKRYARMLANLNETFAKKFPADKTKKSKKKTPIIQHNKFEEEVELNSPIFKALAKKAEQSGIDLSILGEVYNRGYNAYDTTKTVSQEQYAFARVNSFIKEGKTFYSEDADLADAIVLDESNNKPHVRAHMSHTNPEKQVGWKASNKHGKVKYFGLDFKAAANRHAGITEETQLDEISQETAKNYLLKRGPNAHKPTYNTDYHAKIKAKYGNDDPEVKSYDKLEKSHASRVKSLDRAKAKVPGFNHENEMKKKADEHREMIKKYGHKYQTTPEGSGYVVGKSDKKDHAILRVNVSTGVRSKNNDKYEDRHVHVKHLKEEVLEEGKMKELADDLKNLDNGNFKKKYGNHKDHFKNAFNVKEDVEELDEVSKELMKRYLNKAGDSATALIDKAAGHNSTADKMRKIGMAASEVWKQDQAGSKAGKKADKRLASVEKAEKKVNEEAIEEMSNDKLFNYAAKAAEQAQHLSSRSKKYDKRLKGISKAASKIHDNRKACKEEIELDPTKREAGTTSLVRTYLSMTPGQEAANANIDEDVKSADKEPVIVPAHKDAYGHTIPAKVVLRKSNRKIITSGNVHDGEPEDKTPER